MPTFDFDTVTTTLDKLIKDAPDGDLETARKLVIWYEQQGEDGKWYFWCEHDMSSKTDIRPTAEYIRFKRIVLANTDNNSSTSDSVVDTVESSNVGGTVDEILPDGWEKWPFVGPEKNRPAFFYFNKATQTSQWEPPVSIDNAVSSENDLDSTDSPNPNSSDKEVSSSHLLGKGKRIKKKPRYL
jgi:hypothetical protein